MLVQVDLVSRQLYQSRGHLRLNPEDFSNRGVRENNAAIICRQVRSPGLAEPDSSSGNSTGTSFRLYPALKRHLHKVSGGTLACLFNFDILQQGSVSTFSTCQVLNTNEEKLKQKDEVHRHWTDIMLVV